MRKIIAAINMTLDGFCDHTAITPDEEVHQHYADLLSNAGSILYGRITYNLMKYWQAIAKEPTGNKTLDEFAITMDNIPKIVFSKTLTDPEWKSAQLATSTLKEKVSELRQQQGEDVLVGSRSLIMQLLKLQLLDEFQLCIHPVIAGSGLSLFENSTDRIIMNLAKSKIFKGGAVIHYYQPTHS